MNYQDIFHTGVLVPDVAEAIRFYERTLGVTFAAPQRLEGFQIWTPEKGLEVIDVNFTYSTGGPRHIEIQNGTPGSIYDPALHRGDHVGLWVDDVAKEAAEMLNTGWKVKVSAAPPEAGFGVMAYMEPVAGGMVVELVSRQLRPAFERWWETNILEL